MTYEMSWEMVKAQSGISIQYIDIRDEIAFSHGAIPGAVHIPAEDLEAGEGREKLQKGKILLIYCMKGLISLPLAEKLRQEGYEAYSLKGGYGAWLLQSFTGESKEKRWKPACRRNSIRPFFLPLRRAYRHISSFLRETGWLCAFQAARIPC